ncbi:hypothetical protein KM043_001415 [Ampulex compressa]|nr:hypothetical protein KM043_001415 [Ampulex compressa]
MEGDVREKDLTGTRRGYPLANTGLARLAETEAPDPRQGATRLSRDTFARNSAEKGAAFDPREKRPGHKRADPGSGSAWRSPHRQKETERGTEGQRHGRSRSEGGEEYSRFGRSANGRKVLDPGQPPSLSGHSNAANEY